MIEELKEYFQDYIKAYKRQTKPERITTLLLAGFIIGASVAHTVIMWKAYG